jgi:hypothetical protein
MQEYMKISRAFHLGTGISRAFSGAVVACARGFYLVVGENAMRSGFVHGGGPVGALVADFIERRLTPPEFAPGVVVMDLADLPPDVSGHPDWPVRADQGPVIVVPRAAVQSLRYSFWKWGIFVRTATLEIRFEPPLFGRKKMFAFLREAGWEGEYFP